MWNYHYNKIAYNVGRGIGGGIRDIFTVQPDEIKEIWRILVDGEGPFSIYWYSVDDVSLISGSIREVLYPTRDRIPNIDLIYSTHSPVRAYEWLDSRYDITILWESECK